VLANTPSAKPTAILKPVLFTVLSVLTGATLVTSNWTVTPAWAINLAKFYALILTICGFAVGSVMFTGSVALGMGTDKVKKTGDREDIEAVRKLITPFFGAFRGGSPFATTLRVVGRMASAMILAGLVMGGSVFFPIAFGTSWLMEWCGMAATREAVVLAIMAILPDESSKAAA
jgi:hypothetical protein